MRTFPGWPNRFAASKDVLTKFLANADGFRWGLFRMDGSRFEDGKRSRGTWDDPVTGKTFNKDADDLGAMKDGRVIVIG